MMVRALCLWVCLCGVAVANAAQTPALELRGSDEFYEPIVRYAEYLVDGSGQLGAEDVAGRTADFAPISTPHLDFGLTEATIWLSVRLHNPTGRSGPWRINFNRQYVQSIDAYVVSEGLTPALIFSHRASDPFDARPIRATLLAQDFSIPVGSTVTLLIAYTSSATTYLPVGIGTPEAVVAQNAGVDRVNNLLNGMLFAMVALALIMVPIVGWRISVSFAMFIVAGFFYVFHGDGYTFRYLWPGAPWLNDRMNLGFMLLMAAFGLSFVRQIFPFRDFSPRFDLWVKGLMFTAAALFLLALVFVDVRPFMIAAYSAVPVCALTQASAGFVAFRHRIAGAAPYLAGGVTTIGSFGYATVGHLWPGHVDLAATLDVGHLALVFEGFVFATAIVLRMLQIRRERDHSAQAELDLTRSQLELSRRLRQREDEYHRVRAAALQHQQQLSSVSHDLQQPLMSLRAGLSRLGSRDEASMEQLHAAFDYLENLTKNQMAADAVDAPVKVSETTPVEEFDVSAVLDNVHAIFEREAQDNGLAFVYEPASLRVRADPVELMRAVNNLVANAIKHAQHGEVRLGALAADDHVDIVVSDTGVGMNPGTLTRVVEPYAKGEDSTGSGLGLALVHQLAESCGYAFDIQSSPGKGTRCRLSVPCAA